MNKSTVSTDFFIFTKEILNEKLHFKCTEGRVKKLITGNSYPNKKAEEVIRRDYPNKRGYFLQVFLKIEIET